MSNNFTFFGNQMDGGGKRIGFGPIMTFTGGTLTREWGASKADTLEDITIHKVLWSVRNTKKLTLMISRLTNIHQFKFQKGNLIPKFTLQIHYGEPNPKEILFDAMTCDEIRPVEFKDRVIGGVKFELSKTSWNEVFMTVDNPGAIQVV